MELKIKTENNVVCAVVADVQSLDATNAGTLKSEVAAKVPAAKNLVLTLSAIHSIDSAGIGALVTILKTVRKAGGRLGLVGVSPQVYSVLEIIRLTTVFEIYPDESAALVALSPTTMPA